MLAFTTSKPRQITLDEYLDTMEMDEAIARQAEQADYDYELLKDRMMNESYSRYTRANTNPAVSIVHATG